MDARGTREHAQRMAAYDSPHTTTLDDRTGDAITLDEVERIRMERTSRPVHVWRMQDDVASALPDSRT